MPLIPFVHNLESLFFLLFIMARTSGLFLVSPLFSNTTISTSTKALLTLFIAAILMMSLYGDYFGPNPKFVPDPMNMRATGFGIIILTITLAKELAIGFIIGFLFSLIFEALLIAGQLISIMIGLSMSEIIDPISGSSQTIVSQLLMLLTSLIMLCLDMHHLFLRTLVESFQILPIGTFALNFEFIQDITLGSSKFFTYGIRFSAIPYITLFLVTFALGFMAKVMPEMNIFMVGFPLKILVGYYTLIAAIAYMPITLDEAFREYTNLVGLALKHLYPQ